MSDIGITFQCKCSIIHLWRLIKWEVHAGASKADGFAPEEQGFKDYLYMLILGVRQDFFCRYSWLPKKIIGRS